MKGFIKIIFVYIAGAASIFGLLLAGYYQFIYEENIKLEVKTIDVAELTALPEIDGLSATFNFQDSTVTNLWKIRIYISNNGNKNIIGTGDRKDLLTDGLPIYLKDSVSILSILPNDKNFPVSIKNNDSFISLNFKQWKVGEYIEIIGYVENFNNTEPTLYINERDIIDSEIQFSKFEPIDKNVKAKIIDSFSIGWQKTLKWAIILTIIIMDIWAIFAIRKELKKDENTKAIAIIAFIFWLITTLIFSTPLLWIIEL